MNADASSSHAAPSSSSSSSPTSRRHPPAPAPAGLHARLHNNSCSSPARPGQPPATSHASAPTTDAYAHADRAAPPKPSSFSRRSTLPFSFSRFSQSNKTSVTSLVPSTAEGKPIPLDDSTAAHRTSALRELNSNFPSPVARHKYTKSSGAQSSTYSQPVIVRTYSGPTSSQGHSRSNSHANRRGGPRRGVPPTTSTSISYVSPAAHSRPTGARQYAGLLGMGRGSAKKKMPWPWGHGPDPDDPANKLPPYEAFSFKTIMANMQAQSNEVDNALDGIAEIYARSRYSLSNQYEVHVAPHGSGASFISAVPSSSVRRRGPARNSSHSQSGPTLQAIQSDDDDNSAGARPHRKRKGTGRRRSAAYGTLETIMSSSRSSEEDKTKKKSAQELADEVRGRASSKPGQSSTASPNTGAAGQSVRTSEDSAGKLIRKRSKSFANAIIHADNTKNQPSGESASPRNSSSALISEPSMPQTSSSHLEIRTTPNELLGDASTQGSQPNFPGGSEQTATHFLQGLTSKDDPKASNQGLISGLSHWVPWKTVSSGAVGSPQPDPAAPNSSHAEGSLRDLLKTVDVKDKKKGKSVERLE